LSSSGIFYFKKLGMHNTNDIIINMKIGSSGRILPASRSILGIFVNTRLILEEWGGYANIWLYERIE
jgi:hypothetical protein